METETLTAEEKSIIYDIIVSTGVWKNFFGDVPPRSERTKNVKMLFSDISMPNGILKDEKENVLFLYSRFDKDLDPHIKNIFARFLDRG